MRQGWSDKDAAPILGVHPSKVSQALRPSLIKVAKLWRANSTRTMVSIFEELDRLNQIEPMPEEEIALRERILSGRACRREIGQSR